MTLLEAVTADLEARTLLGIGKYGGTLDEAGLSRRDLLQHAYEEMLDGAQYLKALIMQIDAEDSS